MNAPTPRTQRSASRRDFLKRTGAAAAGLALASELAPGLYAAENNTIKVALVGCGGRGTGAASQALRTMGPTKLWAMANVFPDRLEASLRNLSNDAANRQEHRRAAGAALRRLRWLSQGRRFAGR